MKRFCVLVLVFLMAFTVFAQGVKENADYTVLEELKSTDVRVVALKGPTAMGMVKLMEDSKEGSVNGNEYTFSISAAPAEVTPMLVKGEVDIAAVPANLASVLYNNTNGGVKVIAINTLGVLYLVESGNSINSLADLEGKTIYASGKGSTPEFALSFILEESGLADKVKVEWKSEHAECVAALIADPTSVALLPQPFVTTAQMKDSAIRAAIDLNDAWAEVSPDNGLLTGVVVARSEFVKEHKGAVDAFLESYKASTEFVNANTSEAAALVGGFNIVPEKVAAKALPECNIVCITGDDMKNMLSGYLEVLYKANPKSVGGKLPGNDFYY